MNDADMPELECFFDSCGDGGIVASVNRLGCVLAGPFVCSAGYVPRSLVIWRKPSHDEICIHEIGLQPTEDIDGNDTGIRVSLSNGDYFFYDQNNVGDKETEASVRKAWNQRYSVYINTVLSEIRLGRFPSSRRLHSSMPCYGLKRIFADTPAEYAILDGLYPAILKEMDYE